MIENYWYSIPKKKKMFFFGALIICLFSTAFYNVYSDLFDWAISSATTNITDEIFTSLNQAVGETFGSFAEWLGNVLTDPFGPQLNTFNSYANAGGTINAVQIISGFAIFIGIFFSTLIFFFQMFVYLFSGKITDSKDTPISLFVKYGLVYFICYKIVDIRITIINIFNTIQTKYVSTAITKSMEANCFKNLATAIENLITTGLATLTALALPGVGFILLIIIIVIAWIFIKAFFKLYMETVSRYLVSVLLLLLFPAFAGTIVSNNTSQIFYSYLRTLFSSYTVLLFNILWFKICIVIAVFIPTTDRNIILYLFFLLEMLHLGVKIDGLMRSMGLGVASGGSRIGSAIGSAGRNLANTLRSANDMRKNGGKLLQATGLNAGGELGKKMFTLGGRLGSSPSDAFTGKANPNNATANMAMAYGEKGKKIDDNLVSNLDAANIIGKALANPNDMDAQNAVNALSNNKLAEGAQTLMGDKYKVNDASLASVVGADGKKHNAIKVNAQKVNNDGSMADKESSKQEKPFNATLGGAGTFTGGEQFTYGENGDSLHLNTDNAMKNGDRVSTAEFANEGGTKANDALNKAQGFDLNEGSVEKVGRTKDGEDAFNVFDKDGNVCGAINGEDFTASAEHAPDAQNKMFADAKDKIESMGYTCSDFEPVEGQQGVYQAKATDADGNQKVFTAKDKGIYANSTLNDSPERFRQTGTDQFGNKLAYDVNPGKSFTPTDEKKTGSSSKDAEFGKGKGNPNKPNGTGNPNKPNGTGRRLGSNGAETPTPQNGKGNPNKLNDTGKQDTTPKPNLNKFAMTPQTLAQKDASAYTAMQNANGVEIGKVEKVTGANGANSYKCYDNNDNMIGSIQDSKSLTGSEGSTFMATGETSPNTRDAILSDAKDNIESNGYSNCSDFEPTEQPGVYKATAADANGNDVTFTATDTGMYPESASTESLATLGMEDDNGNLVAYSLNTDTDSSTLSGNLDDDFTNSSSDGYVPDKSDNSTLSGNLDDDFTNGSSNGYAPDNNALSSFNSSNSNAHNTEEAVINNSMPENYDNTNVTGQEMAESSESQHRKLPSSDSGKSYDRSKNKKLKPVSKESQAGRIGGQD